MHTLQLGLAVISGLVFVLGLMVEPLANRYFTSQPMLAMLLGVLVGPALLGLTDGGDISGPMLEELSRIALAVGVMGIALQVPQSHMIRGTFHILLLLAVVMPLSAAVAGGLVWWLGGTSLAAAGLVGAILCPTDPVVASSITTSRLAEKSVPHAVRHLIEAESAANDGLAYPLLMIPLLYLLQPDGPVFDTFAIQVVAYQCGVGGLFGAGIGVAVGTGINWLERRRLMKRDAFVAYPVALAITVVSFAEVLHLSSVFAVFCAGLFLVLTTRNRSLETEVRARHTMSQFFEIPLFFLIGLILPWDAWAALGWKAWVFAVGVLFLRRLPLVLVAGHWIAPLRELPERIFVGWFGPIGLSSLYYAAFAVRLTHQPSLWTWVSLAIFASVMVNGVTSTWLTRRYASLRPLAPRDRDEEAAQDDSGPDDGGVPGAHTQH